MTEEELRNVEGVTLSNAHGSLQWVGRTDLTGVNFDLWVTIKHKAVEVYPEDLFTEETKPRRGEKLNKPAIITFYGAFPQTQKEKRNYQRELELRSARMEGELLSYQEDTGEIKIKVFHFTIYTIDD